MARPVNLRHVEIFFEVYRCGSMSGAARALGVSQPAVSKILRHAEIRLGFSLFKLERGRLVPTSEAHILFAEASDLHARAEAFQNTALNLRQGCEGHLRIAALHTLGLQLVPDAIRRLLEKHSDVSVTVSTLHSAELARAVRERACDVGIGFDAPYGDEFRHILLGRADLVVVSPRMGELAPAGNRKPRDSARFIRIINDGTLGTLLDRAVGLREAQGVQLAAQTYFVAAELVNAGLGHTIVDEFTARACSSPSTTIEKVEGGGFDVIGAFRNERASSPLLNNLLDAVKATLSARPPVESANLRL